MWYKMILKIRRGGPGGNRVQHSGSGGARRISKKRRFSPVIRVQKKHQKSKKKHLKTDLLISALFVLFLGSFSGLFLFCSCSFGCFLVAFWLLLAASGCFWLPFGCFWLLFFKKTRFPFSYQSGSRSHCCLCSQRGTKKGTQKGIKKHTFTDLFRAALFHVFLAAF